MEHKEYNGWFNYETWLVNLWLSNDQDSYDMVRDLITDPYGDRAVFDLADALKKYIEESNPLADQANLFSDLINAAIGEVNFDEIAEHWIDDYRSDNPAIPESDEINPDETYVFYMFVNPQGTNKYPDAAWLTLEPENTDVYVSPSMDFWSQFNNIVSEANDNGMKSIIIAWDAHNPL